MLTMKKFRNLSVLDVLGHVEKNSSKEKTHRKDNGVRPLEVQQAMDRYATSGTNMGRLHSYLTR